MVKLAIRTDCGNAPRSAFLKNFNAAFAEGDVAYIAAHLADDVEWHILGDKLIKGKANMMDALALMKDLPVKKMVLHTVITQGREASASGEMHMLTGEVYAFCDAYSFSKTTGTTLRYITSYAVKLENGEMN